MNTTITELMELVKGMTFIEAYAEVEKYFSKIEFSLEQDEWERLTEKNRIELIKKLMSGS